MIHKVLSLLFALLLAVPVFAHGDKKHVIGTVEKLSAEAVVVKTKEGKSVEVKLAPSTTYVTSADQPAKFTDLAVGQRVVIHADLKGANLIAATVKFANAGVAPAAASPK
ncbi:MAG TPA: hypothetical protein VN749_00550 [Candidatus Eisenbacteria bacterium]|jgi:hypothetical protein|nr:hypothetical protein [Candidatus Eisenbacteria bacterium]